MKRATRQNLYVFNHKVRLSDFQTDHLTCLSELFHLRFHEPTYPESPIGKRTVCGQTISCKKVYAPNGPFFVVEPEFNVGLALKHTDFGVS